MPSTEKPMRPSPAAPSPWRRPRPRAGAGQVAVDARLRRRPDAPLAAGRELPRLHDDDPVGTLAAGGDEEVVEVLGGGLRVERQDGALELLGADRLGDVARDEEEGVADAELAAPDLDGRGSRPPGRPPDAPRSGMSRRAARAR